MHAFAYNAMDFERSGYNFVRPSGGENGLTGEISVLKLQEHVPARSYQGQIFVAGYSRSGTKFICNLLERASGGSVEHLGELHFYGRISVGPRIVSAVEAKAIVAKLAAQYARRLNFPYADAVAVTRLVDAARLEGRSQVDVLRSLFAAVATDRNLSQVCDGTPRNAYYLDRILNDFPNGRVIYMMRDPRDAILSQKKKSAKVQARGNTAEARRLAYNYNPAVMARFWKSSAAAYEKVAQNPRVMLVRYEEMLEDPTIVLARLSNFVGVPGLEANADQVRRGNMAMFRDGLTRGEIAAVEAAAGDMPSKYGYETIEANGLYRQISYLTALTKFSLKLPLVYMANNGRFNSILHELRTRLASSRHSSS